MSDISNISGSLLTNLLSGMQPNPIQNADSQAQGVSCENINDIVSLLSGPGSSTDSLYGLLNGTQESDASSSTCNLLIGAANAQLMKDNPALVEAHLQAEQAGRQPSDTDASSGSAQSQETSSRPLENFQKVDLLSISPQSLAVILEKYLQAGTAEPASGPKTNRSV